MSFEIRRGDLAPDLEVTLYDDDEQRKPADLTNALSARLIPFGPLTIKDPANGVCTYSWRTGDTATVRTVQVEAEVMWPGNKPQTFPIADAIDVLPDKG
jgi:hypothetical protein